MSAEAVLFIVVLLGLAVFTAIITTAVMKADKYEFKERRNENYGDKKADKTDEGRP